MIQIWICDTKKKGSWVGMNLNAFETIMKDRRERK